MGVVVGLITVVCSSALEQVMPLPVGPLCVDCDPK